MRSRTSWRVEYEAEEGRRGRCPVCKSAIEPQDRRIRTNVQGAAKWIHQTCWKGADAMKVPAKGTGGGTDGYGRPFAPNSTPPPILKEGTKNAVCVDYIDMGEIKTLVYGSKTGETEMVHKCKFIYQVGEKMPDGRRYLLAFRPFGVRMSMHENAALRQHLEGFAGREFVVDEDVDFDSFVGQPCVIIVKHSKSADGTKTYANIEGIGPHMEGLPVLKPEGYVRVKDREATGNGAQAAAEGSGFEQQAEDVIPF